MWRDTQAQAIEEAIDSGEVVVYALFLLPAGTYFRVLGVTTTVDHELALKVADGEKIYERKVSDLRMVSFAPK